MSRFSDRIDVVPAYPPGRMTGKQEVIGSSVGLVPTKAGMLYRSGVDSVQFGGRITGTRSRRPAPMERAPRLRFDADVVVHSSANPLLAAEIAFGCLHGDVTKKKLDLV